MSNTDEITGRLQQCLKSPFKEAQDAALTWFKKSGSASPEMFNVFMDCYLKTNDSNVLEALAAVEFDADFVCDNIIHVFEVLLERMDTRKYWAPQLLHISAHLVPHMVQEVP
jgi:hypothetical protein